MAAQISDKLIHVCHIFVLIPFLVYGTVNNAVCLTFYGKCQVCKQYGYPEFLEYRILRAAPDLLQGDAACAAFMIVDGVQMKENRLYYMYRRKRRMLQLASVKHYNL